MDQTTVIRRLQYGAHVLWLMADITLLLIASSGGSESHTTSVVHCLVTTVVGMVVQVLVDALYTVPASVDNP